MHGRYHHLKIYIIRADSNRNYKQMAILSKTGKIKTENLGYLKKSLYQSTDKCKSK